MVPPSPWLVRSNAFFAKDPAAQYPPRPAHLSRSSTAGTALPAMSQFPAFLYPPDMTNYEWTLEFSTNLSDWQIVGAAFDPGLPGGSLTVTNQGAIGFYRMHGVPR